MSDRWTRFIAAQMSANVDRNMDRMMTLGCPDPANCDAECARQDRLDAEMLARQDRLDGIRKDLRGLQMIYLYKGAATVLLMIAVMEFFVIAALLS
jgi:hypothetical protein